MGRLSSGQITYCDLTPQLDKTSLSWSGSFPKTVFPGYQSDQHPILFCFILTLHSAQSWIVVGEERRDPSAVWTERYFFKNERANIDAQAIPFIHVLCEAYRHTYTLTHTHMHKQAHGHSCTHAHRCIA